MKLRKHINNKRLERLDQLGSDRILDLQFGAGDAAHHVILELYDRGNVVLTDSEYKILNVLRPRVQGEDKFLVRETYPVELFRDREPQAMTGERLAAVVAEAKPGDNLRKVFARHFEYGPALFEHLLLTKGLSGAAKVGKDFDVERDGGKVLEAFQEAPDFVRNGQSKGYVIHKKESRPKADGTEEELTTYVEFHPFLLRQHEEKPHQEFETFDRAVDEFFSKVQSMPL